MAVDYLSRTGATSRACRFDVVAIDNAGTSPHVTVYTRAFDVG
jgi:Holliday junction resolvase-like predicted endonuclease